MRAEFIFYFLYIKNYADHFAICTSFIYSIIQLNNIDIISMLEEMQLRLSEP